jgi:serine phosphatase RsbU (regulator of sigma subunit)
VIVVLVIGGLITAGLAIGAHAVHDANENRLLRQRVREVAAVTTASFPTVQIPLASAAVVADATNGDAAAFRRLMQPIVSAGRPFVSASLWPAGAAQPRPLVVVGRSPELASKPPSEVRTVLQRASTASVVSLNDMLDAPDRRLGYAYAESKNAKFIVYGENALPHNRRARIDSNQAFSDLDYALFLGKRPTSQELLASSTGGARLRGRTMATSVPFGDSQLMVVLSPRGELGGSLLARLWWILTLFGLLLTLAAAGLVGRLSIRRREAEHLADENAQLYTTQRSVALTLQHSLVNIDFPAIPAVEFAARYVPGGDGVEVGGDWYDVVALEGRRVMLAVGDVSGRGLPAATTMASLRFSMRAYAVQGDEPGSILTKLSDLVSLARDDHFATVFCAVLDLDARVMRCANAGHPEPLLVSPGGGEFVDTVVAMPVGVRSGVKYEETVVSLPAAGTLYLYTDGVIERRGEDLADGRARLAGAATGTPGALDDNLTSVLAEAIPSGATDDAALLAIRWDLAPIDE